MCSSEAPEMPRKKVITKRISNKAKCNNCGDIIESRYNHHFVTCTCYIESTRLINDYPEHKKYRKTYSKKTGNWTLPYYRFIHSMHGIAIDGGLDCPRSLFYNHKDLVDISEYQEINVTKVRNRVKLRGNRFAIKRTSDGFGSSGYITCHTLDNVMVGKHGEIRVGCRIRCGGLTASTFGNDGILTSMVKTIVDVAKDKSSAVVETENSVYNIRRIN